MRSSVAFSGSCQSAAWIAPAVMHRVGAGMYRIRHGSLAALMDATASVGTYVEMRAVVEWASEGSA